MWRTAHRSFYYENLDADALPEPRLPVSQTALLLIDLQQGFIPQQPPPDAPDAALREYTRWLPFVNRLNNTVLPNVTRLLNALRPTPAARAIVHTRITSRTADGRERSISHARLGFNNLHFPPGSAPAQFLPQVAPLSDEIVLGKTTDSALASTPLRLILNNLQIRHVIVAGIYTDQCVSCTVRALADENYDVILVEDATAAATDALHNAELAILNNIYCQVLTTEETINHIITNE
ncbi:MAG: cysteine hydrolase [Opitutaceae bacterium]|jgi:nicotinamidase-related amidase|nr:cysteine hydrolase [Opitutaceae bacterium]